MSAAEREPSAAGGQGLNLNAVGGRLSSAGALEFAALLQQGAAPLEQCAVTPLFEGARYACTLDNVLSPGECEALIAETEKKGYTAALLNMGDGTEQLRTDVRSSHRCIVDSPGFADALFARVQHAIPRALFGASLVGLNERLRFLRYDPGETFKIHRDGVFERGAGPLEGEFTLITLLLYLNTGYEGCFTRFFKDHGIEAYVPEGGLPVEPGVGRVLLHEHSILHSAPPLTKGRKYVLRTDVLYKN